MNSWYKNMTETVWNLGVFGRTSCRVIRDQVYLGGVKGFGQRLLEPSNTRVVKIIFNYMIRPSKRTRVVKINVYYTIRPFNRMREHSTKGEPGRHRTSAGCQTAPF